MTDRESEKPRLRISFQSLGCKTNRADAIAILDRLPPSHFELVPFGEPCDVALVYTCAVTRTAERQSRQEIYRASRRSPEAKVIAGGCLVRLRPESLLEKQPELVLEPNAHGDATVRQLYEMAGLSTDDAPACHAHDIAAFAGHSRPFVKVQDGCRAPCTYCTIPMARGKLESVPPEDVVRKINVLHDAGFEEIVLTGINLSYYGADLGGKVRDVDLLRAIEDGSRCRRVRISSIEPIQLKEEFVEIFATSTAFCPHLHVPLQSASEAVLESMRRRYAPDWLRGRIEELFARMPTLTVGLDVIFGFPGETERDAVQTMEFIEHLPVGYLHVFSFSARPETPAAAMEPKVPPEVVKRRVKQAQELGTMKKRELLKKRAAQECVEEVLIEGRKGGSGHGFTRDYLPVRLERDPDPAWTKTIRSVRITGWDAARNVLIGLAVE